MNFGNCGQTQIWVAGGIGITPFMAYLREDHPQQKIDLYYSFNGPASGVYKEFIEDYQKRNPLFTAHFIDSSVASPLTIDQIEISAPTDVFMCGPVKMVKTLPNGFGRNEKIEHLSYEAFQLR